MTSPFPTSRPINPTRKKTHKQQNQLEKLSSQSESSFPHFRQSKIFFTFPPFLLLLLLLLSFPGTTLPFFVLLLQLSFSSLGLLRLLVFGGTLLGCFSMKKPRVHF